MDGREQARSSRHQARSRWPPARGARRAREQTNVCIQSIESRCRVFSVTDGARSLSLCPNPESVTSYMYVGIPTCE